MASLRSWVSAVEQPTACKLVRLLNQRSCRTGGLGGGRREAKGSAPPDGGPDYGPRRSRFRSRVNPATLRRLALQDTALGAHAPDVQHRLTAAVDDLQQVIQDIRAAIFELPGGSFGITGCASASTRRSPASPDRNCTPRCNSAARYRLVDATPAGHAEAVVKTPRQRRPACRGQPS